MIFYLLVARCNWAVGLLKLREAAVAAELAMVRGSIAFGSLSKFLYSHFDFFPLTG
jgi:hypothetical protein